MATLNISPNQQESTNSRPEGGLQRNTVAKFKSYVQQQSIPLVTPPKSTIQKPLAIIQPIPSMTVTLPLSLTPSDESDLQSPHSNTSSYTASEVPDYSPVRKTLVDNDMEDQLLHNVASTLVDDHLAPTDSLVDPNHPSNDDIERELAEDDHNTFHTQQTPPTFQVVHSSILSINQWLILPPTYHIHMTILKPLICLLKKLSP
ncbi:hypothetical protein RYX36_033755 [Vicia faba]